MRISLSVCVFSAGTLLAAASPSAAQRIAFERSYTVGQAPTLDVSTIRGKIDISVGEPDRVVVRGTTTVRVGLTSPPTAYELAKKVAANPPIQQEVDLIRLRPPLGEADRVPLSWSA